MTFKADAIEKSTSESDETRLHFMQYWKTFSFCLFSKHFFKINFDTKIKRKFLFCCGFGNSHEYNHIWTKNKFPKLQWMFVSVLSRWGFHFWMYVEWEEFITTNINPMLDLSVGCFRNIYSSTTLHLNKLWIKL